MSTMTLRNAHRYLADADVDLPDNVRKYTDVLDALPAAQPDGTADLLADARSGQLDPAEVADRVAAVAGARATAAAAGPIIKALRAELEAAALRALRTRESHEAVIAALRPAFDQAVDCLRVAQAHGVTHATTPDEAAKLGTDAVIARARLNDAHDLLQRVTLARSVTASSTLNAEHMTELDSVKPARSTGPLAHQWESCLEYADTVPAILAAGMTPRLNTNAEAQRVKAAAEVPPARLPDAAQLSRERREDEAHERLRQLSPSAKQPDATPAPRARRRA